MKNADNGTSVLEYKGERSTCPRAKLSSIQTSQSILNRFLKFSKVFFESRGDYREILIGKYRIAKTIWHVIQKQWYECVGV